MNEPFSLYVQQCLRHNNLVYIRNLKCASTFFYNNFQINFKWQVIKFSDINWDNDCVFGHIIDPIEHRIKGVAEFIYKLNLADDFITNIGLQFLVNRSMFLDIHSVPYCVMFGDYVRKIDWIPLGPSKISNILVTQKLLNYYGISTDVNDWDLSHEHTSESKKKQIEEIIRKNHVDNTVHKEMAWQNMYRNIKDNHWPECPALDNFIELPEEIRKELASHYVGENCTISDDFKTLNIPKSQFDQGWLSFYHEDIKLFHEIETKFNKNADTWNNISWLSK